MLLCAIAFAACGDDDSDDVAAKTEYLKKADAICAKANKLSERLKPGASSAAVTRFLERNVDVRAKVAAELEALDVPDDLETKVDDYDAQSEAIIADQRKNAELARAEDLEQPSLDAQVSRRLIERTRVAAEIGYEQCGGGAAAKKYDDELIEQADAACDTVNDTIAKAGGGRDQYGAPNYPEAGDADAQAELYKAVLPAHEASLEKLKALRPSSDAAEPYKQFLDAYEERVGLTGELLKAVEDGDQKALDKAVEEDRAAFRQEFPAAQTLGFEVCGGYEQGGV